MDSFNSRELCKRVVKYVLQGAIVAIAAILLPDNKPKFQDVIALALVAACTFAIVDSFAPSMSYPVQLGAGFGIGANMVGFGH